MSNHDPSSGQTKCGAGPEHCQLEAADDKSKFSHPSHTTNSLRARSYTVLIIKDFTAITSWTNCITAAKISLLNIHIGVHCMQCLRGLGRKKQTLPLLLQVETDRSTTHLKDFLYTFIDNIEPFEKLFLFFHLALAVFLQPSIDLSRFPQHLIRGLRLKISCLANTGAPEIPKFPT